MHAADEERRRIGRDLHDGAQQRLVALGTSSGSRAARPATCPRAAAELLDGAAEQAQLASGELRELARGLHPAGLSERGLRVALRPWRRARRSTCTSPRCPSAGCPSRSS